VKDLFFIRFCLLWSLVSLHVVGGAVLFRRFFPRESPWFGFVVPALALVLVMNFTEHVVAIPSLRILLPFTTVGCLWLIVSPQTRWRRLRLPTILFLCSFAFTLFLRFLKPDIAGARDGIYDLQFISTFCMGQTLPAESTWIPPLQLINYYAFGHYGCSVLIRLFGLDLGTGFNVSAALVSAWIYFLTAGVAWQIGRRKLWITILAPILVACAGTGSSGYLWLALSGITPEDIASLYSRMDNNQVQSALFHYLTPVYMYDRHELLVPGWWSWMGIFHSTSVGGFLTLLATLSITEIVRPRRSTWSWICCAGSVPFMLVSSTWGFPFVTLLVFTALGWCWYMKRVPREPRWVVLGLGLIAACLTPMLLYYLTSSTPIHGFVSGEEHTQVVEFLVQWWPVYLPYIALLLTCRRIHPAVGVVLFAAPLAFLGVEFYTVGARFDMTGKIWGFIFCAAWATFIPAIAISRFWLFRLLFGLIVINSALSFCFWATYTWQTITWDDFGELEGKGDLFYEPKKARILNTLLPLKNQIITTGESAWSFCPSARIANFSGNRDYITWSFNCDNDMFRNGLGEGWRREKDLNDFYAGKNPNALLYLRQRNIAAVVIWPDDDIKDDVLAKLKEQMAPSYQYEDLRDVDNHDPPNCGIFLYHPNLLHELPSSPNPTAPTDD
jgi:hypothetical protein